MLNPWRRDPSWRLLDRRAADSTRHVLGGPNPFVKDSAGAALAFIAEDFFEPASSPPPSTQVILYGGD